MSRRLRRGGALAGALALAAAAVWALGLSAAERSAAAQAHMQDTVVVTSIPAPVVASAQPAAKPTTTPGVDVAWVNRAASRTGIPARALQAYATAQLLVAAEEPGCGLSWNTLAGIGWVESAHGSHDGGTLRSDGHTDADILGPALAGGVRAAGPMQFIPSTWQRWGSDGNADGVADPQQIDDAALTAARYLCASGSVRGTTAWRAAVFSYNHSADYVDRVAAAAQAYASRMR